jgi:hypothetical protein
VAADGAVRGEGLAPGAAPEEVAEAALGPALVLGLALRRIFCLHAGAVARGDRAVAFVGGSGAGKSTLAARLPGAGDGGWRRVADDVLPVAADGGAVWALAHFPQFKLAPAEQAAGAADARLRLAAVYLLDPAEEVRGEVTARDLGGRDAAVALARHTVAARLFAPAELGTHLDFCAQAAARLPVRRLAYPRRLDVLPAVAAAVAADLEPR